MLFAFMDADFCLVCIGNYSIASLSHEAFANHQMTNDSASIYYLQDLFRLPALMDLYIHPLYVLVSKILSFILNSLAPIHPLSTISTVGLTCHFI
jgi:hypothetical protein